MKKLWKVTVNDWGWDHPVTLYALSRTEAEELANKYPASDPVQYAGNFSPAAASKLLGCDDYS